MSSMTLLFRDPVHAEPGEVYEAAFAADWESHVLVKITDEEHPHRGNFRGLDHDDLVHLCECGNPFFLCHPEA